MNIAWQDLLWLLLPLAAASGWYAARREARRHPPSPSDRFSSEYFRGINFLLNEQPDKAIEIFTQMVDVNSETVETHLALGSLFRRRGEVERAIRIHQNLVARPSMDKSQRAVALCELALDYQKAGLLDRAENLFLELTEINEHAEQALRSLMHIYEQEKDWMKALAAGQRLADRFGRDLAPVLAQYCCEMAEHRLQDSDTDSARKLLAEALKHDPRCARANMISGRLAMSSGRVREAIAFWQKVRDQDCSLLGEVIDEIADAYRALDDETGLRRYLEQVTAEQTGTRVLRILIELIDRQEGGTAAWTSVAGIVRKQPSLLGLQELLDLLVRDNRTPGDVGVVRDILARLTEPEGGYVCGQCGFQGRILHWQCPACHEWLALRPKVSCANSATGVYSNPSEKLSTDASHKAQQI